MCLACGDVPGVKRKYEVLLRVMMGTNNGGFARRWHASFSENMFFLGLLSLENMLLYYLGVG